MSATAALLFKSRRHAANVSIVLRCQSTFKVYFITVFALACEAGLWLLFRDAFRFLDTLGGVGIMILDRLFSVFFFGMGLMLATSGVVTSYATLFQSAEIPFLLTRPFSMRQVVTYKSIEAGALSSWAFMFVIIPFIGAYAVHQHGSVFLALWTFLFSIPFLLICAALGTGVSLLVVRWFPIGRRVIRVLLAAFALAVTGGVIYLARHAHLAAGGGDVQLNLMKLIPGLQLASNPLLPSWWVAEGILSFSRAEWGRGLLLLALTLSSAAVLQMLVQDIGTATFYSAWQRTVGSRQAGEGRPVILAGLERGLAFLRPPIRAMVMKDLRTFFRDPMQWSQSLIFFGLLALYFGNLRSFNYHMVNENFRNAIAFLNVFSVSAVMCSLASRFIYPQLSLEGQGFWIIGLSPVTMTQIVLTKFALAVAGMGTVSVWLMLLSSGMLGASPATRVVAVAVAAAMSVGVSGLSIGLGAVFLDLKQRNPAAIVSGFGGTLNLVLSLGFMLGSILPFGFLFHLHTIQRLTTPQFNRALLFGGLWLAAITALTAILPLWLGIQSLRRREF